jgi:hypothetical protein
MIEIVKYIRKPFEVDAVQVTADNMSEVANWCGGEVLTDNGNNFVKVSVERFLNERQTKAFNGDWVLKAGTGYKVYTPKAFSKSFEPLTGVARDNATQAEKAQPVIAVG